MEQWSGKDKLSPSRESLGLALGHWMTQNDFYNLYNTETTCITWESQFGGINETMCKIAVLHIAKKKNK